MTDAVTEPTEILASDWCPGCQGDGEFFLVNSDGEPDDVVLCGTCDGDGFVTL